LLLNVPAKYACAQNTPRLNSLGSFTKPALPFAGRFSEKREAKDEEKEKEKEEEKEEEREEEREEKIGR